MKQKIIACLLLLIILVIGSVFWLTQSQTAMTGAQDIIRTELSNAIGSMVTIGQIEMTSYNTITIHDITIYDKQAEVLVASEKTTVTYSLLSLLRGQAVVNAISEVAVEKPTMWLTQFSNGRWNVQDLLNQENTTKTSFAGKVTLHDGVATLKSSGAMWTFETMNASMDFANKPRMDLQLQAVHKGTPVTAKGSINIQGRSNLTVTAGELFVADYQVLLTDVPLGFVGGSVKNLEVTVNQDKGDIKWAGEAGLLGVDMDVDGIPLRAIQGNLSFTNKKIYVFATGKVFEQPIDIRGSIRTDTSTPVLDMVVSSAAFDPMVIANVASGAKDVPFSGILAFKANLTGLTTNPIISADAQLATGQMAGYEIRNGEANVLLMDKTLTINKFSADMLGGQIAVTGTGQLEDNNFQLHLKAQQIDVAYLADLIPDSSGRGDVDVRVKGTASSIGDADVQGTVAIGQGKMAGVDFTALGVGFDRHNGIITIDYANINLAQGLVTSSGTIDHQNINLMVYGQNIPLQQLDNSATGLVSGNGDFAGQLTGTLSAPELAGHFSLTNGQLLYQPFTLANGTIHGNRQQLIIDDMELVDGVTTHQVHGSLGLDDQHEMNLMVKTHQARAENLIKLLAPGEKLTGNVDNEMTLTGSLANVNAQGRILLTDGSFRGQLISKIQGVYKREFGTTTISQVSIESLGAQITLAGTISPTNELNFDMIAQDIDMKSLSVKLPYPIVGRTQFTGKLTGTLSAPAFNGQFSATQLLFNNQEVTGVAGNITFADNEINIPNVSFKQGMGKFSFAGSFALDTSEVAGNLDAEEVDLQPLLAAFNVPAKDINGKLNGHIRVGGTLQRPNVGLVGTLTHGSIKKYPVESIIMDVTLEDNVVKINELSATQGVGRLVARGTANLDGPLALEVGGQDIDAGLVAALFKTTVEPIGKMTFAAQISGVTSNPYAAISLEIVNGGVGTATFDSLYGLLIVDNNTIHVNQVLLKKGPYQASAYGTIPVSALSPTGRSKASSADQMDLKLRLDEANLSILPLLTKQVAWAEGPTQGEINIAGTLQQPIITGNVTINNGVIKLTALKKPIQKVGVDISFEGDTINIKKFDGYLGKGSYSITGIAKIHDMALSDYDISLVLDKPELESKYFTGVVEGNLNINNKGTKPKLSGKVLFANDLINIPTIPEMAASDLDMDLDIDMRFGKKVRFYNPNLYDILAVGHVKFAGSTQHPDFTGRILAIRGSVNYLRTKFTVSEASVEFRQFAAFAPIVKLNAQTTIQQRTVNLNVNGPVDAMDFKLTTEPAMRQEEILSLLTLRSGYVEGSSGGIGRSEVVSVVGAGLQLQFIGDVESKFRNVLGLDEFHLVKDTTSTSSTKRLSSNSLDSTAVSQEVYNVEMSKSLTDKLLLTYTMGVDYNKSELALRYSINRHTNVNTSIDETKNIWFGVETKYRF